MTPSPTPPIFLRVAPLLLLAACLLVPHSVTAQNADLTRAERLVEEGRFAEARELVAAWWDGSPQSAQRDHVQLGLWLRGLLTIDPSLAELDYRRLVVEYPGGRFSDEALLRLAKGSEAQGDTQAARSYLEILLRDYPQSPLRVDARSRLARLPTSVAARPSPEREPGPERIPEEAPPPELEPEIEFAPPAQEDVPDEVEVAPEPPPVGAYTIQLGAFSTLDRAHSLAERARGEGLDVRVVKVEGSELVRVRFGAFLSREEAEALARDVRALHFEAVISSDREREEEAG